MRLRTGTVAFLLLAAGLRFFRLETAPGWFLDEGTYFDVARNLLGGERLSGEMRVTFISPYMTAPPVWFFAQAGWMWLFGETMLAFRALVALCGVVCVALAGDIARRLAGPKAGFWTLAFLAAAPRAVLYSRMAIPYAPASMLLLAWLWLLMPYGDAARRPAACRARWALGLVAAVLAPLTLYYAVLLIPVGMIWAATAWMRSDFPAEQKTARTVALSVVVAAAGFGAWLLWGHWAWGEAFRVDFAALRRDATAGSLERQGRHWLEFLTHWGGLAPAGLLGLFLLRRTAAAVALSVMTLFLCHIVLRRLDAQVLFIDYPMMTAYPFLCIGAGTLASRVATLGRRVFGATPLIRLGARVITVGVALVFIALVGRGTLAVATAWKHPWTTPTLAFGMIESFTDARAVAEWVNEYQRASPEHDKRPLVLASSSLWPLLEGPRTDINQFMAARGQGAHFYNYECRAAASPDLRGERIGVVIEDFMSEHRRLSVREPGGVPAESPFRAMADALEIFHTQWQPVLRRGGYRVLLPPDAARP
jgi:4-amino-4-deoxy-L-arabinose transferase-like glycosyltransferase